MNTYRSSLERVSQKWQPDGLVCPESTDGTVAIAPSSAWIARGCASRKYGHGMRRGVADGIIGFGVCM